MNKIKTVGDYVSQVKEKFPFMSEKDIQTILEHGFRHFYLLNTAGADIIVSSLNKNVPKFSCYIGKILKNNKLMNKYIVIKRAIKFRLRWLRKKVEYDGFYYFNVNEEQYQSYLSQKKRRASITFPGTLKLHKIFSEVYTIGDQVNCYAFKVAIPDEGPFVIKQENFSTKDAIYLGKRGSDGELKLVDENEKKRHKQPYRRHSNRLCATKHSR